MNSQLGTQRQDIADLTVQVEQSKSAFSAFERRADANFLLVCQQGESDTTEMNNITGRLRYLEENPVATDHITSMVTSTIKDQVNSEMRAMVDNTVMAALQNSTSIPMELDSRLHDMEAGYQKLDEIYKTLSLQYEATIIPLIDENKRLSSRLQAAGIEGRVRSYQESPSEDSAYRQVTRDLNACQLGLSKLTDVVNASKSGPSTLQLSQGNSSGFSDDSGPSTSTVDLDKQRKNGRVAIYFSTMCFNLVL